MASTYDIEVIQGVTTTLSLNIKDDNGIPLNLSGYSAAGYGKYRYANSGYLINLNPQITSTVSGTMYIEISAQNNVHFPVGSFYYDVFIHYGSTYTNILQGMINVSPSIFGISTGNYSGINPIIDLTLYV